MFSRTLCGINQIIRVFAKPQTIGCRLYSVCINQNMMKHRVVPDVITTPPKNIAKVEYRSGAKVLQGNELKPRQVKDAPDVSWRYEPGAFYTLCMIDPDAPSRDNPQFREWHHWLVGNIPCDEVFKGEILSAYIGSGPPKGSGLHRYVFLVYMQPKKLIFNEKRLPNNTEKGRKKFCINRFSKKYYLGEPIAGNFFQAQWDDYVPELYKKLGA